VSNHCIFKSFIQSLCGSPVAYSMAPHMTSL